MKLTRSAKLLTGLGLMAGLFWGCQDLLSQKDGSAKEPEAIATDESVLRLSIKDDRACREQWNVILDARARGLADTAAEKSFLANCVKEIKPGKDKLPPVIPPHLQPDSTSRCHWIVSQIDAGRNEMTVSYKRYCPEDCRNLEDKDSTRHVRLCRDPHVPGVDTTKPPVDTTKPPGSPLEDSCKMARDSIAGLDTGSVKYKILREFLLLRCGKPPIPPRDTFPKPPEDTCRMFRDSIAGLDTASAEYRSLRIFLMQRCGFFPLPNDTIVKPPLPKDTLPKPPITECEAIMKKLMSVPVGGPDYMILKDMYNRVCTVPRDTTVIPPIVKDSLLTPGKFVVNCDELRATLLTAPPASVVSQLLVDAIREHCPEVKPKKK